MQSLAVGQARSATFTTPLGMLSTTHVVPPLDVPRITAFWTLSSPETRHTVDEEQEIPCRSSIASGTVWAIHVVPPFVVASISPVGADPPTM
jgi:hypothetical protein